MSEFDKGIRGLVNPGYRSPDEIAKEKNEEFYHKEIVPTLSGQKKIEPLGSPIVKSMGDYLLETPLNIDIVSAKPVVTKKTTFTDKEFENYLKEDAKRKEQVRKFRQDPKWVASYNKRFGPAFKTTVLPKDEPERFNDKILKRGKYEPNTVQQLKNLNNWAKKKTGLDNNWSVDKSGLPKTPVQKKREQWQKKVEENKNKKKPMNIVKYVNRMNHLYSNTPQEEPEDDYWATKMATEEADHLNNIKRQNWNNGGRVGPEPKYVTKEDVINVYKGPKATPEQVKGLHQRLKNHNERTGEMKHIEKVIDYYEGEDQDHPYIQGKMEEIKAIEDKGKSWLVKHLRKQNRESENGQTIKNNKRRYI
tara:strand:- start:3753 stop:4838 length:1086 start_codon:yes stop_codon:yes gene_type:complete